MSFLYENEYETRWTGYKMDCFVIYWQTRYDVKNDPLWTCCTPGII